MADSSEEEADEFLAALVAHARGPRGPFRDMEGINEDDVNVLLDWAEANVPRSTTPMSPLPRTSTSPPRQRYAPPSLQRQFQDYRDLFRWFYPEQQAAYPNDPVTAVFRANENVMRDLAERSDELEQTMELVDMANTVNQAVTRPRYHEAMRDLGTVLASLNAERSQIERELALIHERVYQALKAQTAAQEAVHRAEQQSQVAGSASSTAAHGRALTAARARLEAASRALMHAEDDYETAVRNSGVEEVDRERRWTMDNILLWTRFIHDDPLFLDHPDVPRHPEYARTHNLRQYLPHRSPPRRQGVRTQRSPRRSRKGGSPTK